MNESSCPARLNVAEGLFLPPLPDALQDGASAAVAHAVQIVRAELSAHLPPSLVDEVVTVALLDALPTSGAVV
ncbi:hypothetical protein [Deinococcus radiotolerans]|uniref:Uncharacterized protein n=1 Tax=Deinococcus radiotolerans TaxID=1309407 RepID=A0ABQ2FIN8_9DEIO|nr:hypothetical protein [Deinococcus radiotolerans]GGK90969.1 hypothetical protein GCM10010844_06920 [Deinococcus radiotolerans]